jgi:very-short-patch-repair endonuclease
VRNLVVVSGTRIERVGTIADLQRGRVNRAQLLSVSVSDRTIRTLIKGGTLSRRHRGVYIFGHTTGVEFGDETAALLACGWDAALTSESCLAVWRLVKPPAGPVHVAMADGAHLASRPGIRVHRSRNVDPRDLTVREGLPTTTPARALLDYADAVLDDADDCTERELERALDEGLSSRKVSRTKVQDVLDRSGNGHRGAPMLQELISVRRPLTITDSDKEEKVLALTRAAGVPDPHCQARLHGFRADFYWPEARFVLEVDSMIGHSSRSKMRRDRTKDAVFRDHGLEVMRVMWDDLDEQPLAVLGRLIRAIERRLPRDAAAA